MNLIDNYISCASNCQWPTDVFSYYECLWLISMFYTLTTSLMLKFAEVFQLNCSLSLYKFVNS